MFSPAQASVSLRPLPPIPTQATFNLLLRFCARKSAGTPNATAPAARELVLMNSRRSIGEGERPSEDFKGSRFSEDFTSNSILAGIPVSKIPDARGSHATNSSAERSYLWGLAPIQF